MTTFNRGIPTEIDVIALIEAFGVPAVGQIIPHDSIESVVCVEKTKYRYKTVVAAWRRKLEREHNIIFRAVSGTGYEVLDSRGRVDLSGNKYKAGLRAVRRSSSIALRTDRRTLTKEEETVLDHIIRVNSTIQTVAATEARKLTYPGGD